MAVRNFLDKNGLELYDELIKHEIDSVRASNFTAEDREKLDGISDEANKVSYTSSLDSGTKIGELSIDDDSPIDLYAPTPTSESDIAGMGFTKNTGTITGITMNGASKGSSGVVDLGTVITDVSGKQDSSTAVKYGGSAAVGSATQGVYVDASGNATAMTYELNKTVPADAVFTDTTYENKTAVSGGTDVSLVTTGDKYNWNNKVDKSGTDSLMTADEHTKLAGISAGAEVNVQSDWDQTVTGADDYIKNKPTLGTAAAKDVGVANGVAELDSTGKVPSSQLPAYVDDVLEYSSLSGFPATGETGKIYVDTSTDKTYRWSGTAYVQIKGDLALGETSSTAYRGDRGKVAYDHASAKGSAFSSGLYKITTNAEGHVTAASAVATADITALGIPGSDTTYESLPAAKDSDALSLVTAGEKYEWNDLLGYLDANKVDGISWNSTNKKLVQVRGGESSDIVTGATILSGLTKSQVTTALGYEPPTTDTKNTAGSTDTSSKIFLIGATSQAANPQTYSHDTAYVGTDGCLYSNNTKVLTAHQTVTDKAPTLSWGSTSTVATIGSTNITVKMPSNPNTNTTYTFATGDANGQIKVTPSGGSAQNVDVKGLGTAAYKASTDFAVSKTLTNENLNSVTEPGFYNAAGSNGCTNVPSDVGTSGFGLVVTHTAGGTYYSQELNICGTANYYRRNCNNGTWSAWTKDKYTDTTYTFTNKSATLAYGSTSTIATVGGTDITVTMPADSGNTKNTVGTTNKTGTKMFLVGGTEQSANPQTYSNSNCYIGTDNCLYSGGTKVLTAHQTITNKAVTLAYGSTSTVATIGSTNITVTMPADADTKNTAGSTDTSSKIFLIGATSQAANPQTYSHDTAYVGTDGCLYSGGTKVLTSHQDISGKVNKSGDTMTGALNFANNIANKVGDDVQIGDHNKGGSLGIQSSSSTNNTAITLIKGGATWGASSEGCSMVYNSTNKCIDFVFAA